MARTDRIALRPSRHITFSWREALLSLSLLLALLLAPCLPLAAQTPADDSTEIAETTGEDSDSPRPDRYGPWRAELFLLSFSTTSGPDGSDHEASAGVRAIREFSNDWAAEISYTRATGLTFDDLEYDLVDLSLRRVLYRRAAYELFGFGGAGWGRFQVSGDFSSDSESSITGHLGLGLDISFGRRFYLRTEYRRRLAERIELEAEDLFLGTRINRRIDRDLDGDVSIAFGWRL